MVLCCLSKIEIPYYSVPFYKKSCIWCGISGTPRMLGQAVYIYEKYMNCNDGQVEKRESWESPESDVFTFPIFPTFLTFPFFEFYVGNYRKQGKLGKLGSWESDIFTFPTFPVRFSDKYNLKCKNMLHQ